MKNPFPFNRIRSSNRYISKKLWGGWRRGVGPPVPETCRYPLRNFAFRKIYLFEILSIWLFNGTWRVFRITNAAYEDNFYLDIRDYQIPTVPTNFMCGKLVTSPPVMVFLLHGNLLAYAVGGHAKALL